MRIKLLKVEEDISWLELKKYVPFLTVKRQERCERYINEHDKCISLLTELLIRKEIGNGKCVELTYNQYGKPYVANKDNIYFSISHSKDYIVYIDDDEEIGIDIEYIKKFNSKIVKRFFTLEESTFLENSKDINNDGYKLWTRKEAFLKRNGTGFSNGGYKLNIIDEELNDYMYTTKLDDYMISVCASKPIDKVDIRVLKVKDVLDTFPINSNSI